MPLPWRFVVGFPTSTACRPNVLTYFLRQMCRVVRSGGGEEERVDAVLKKVAEMAKRLNERFLAARLG